MTESRITPFYRTLGAVIRSKRVAKGMSQETLGKSLGVTFQQVQKYELGMNRLPVDMLCTIAQAVGVPVSELLAEAGNPHVEPGNEAPPTRAMLELNRLTARLPHAHLVALKNLAKALVAESEAA
jgi:transcriptional regulator with XRE-family HTH domain